MQSSKTSNRLCAQSTSPLVKQEPESQLMSLVSILKLLSVLDSVLFAITRPVTPAEMIFLQNFAFPRNHKEAKCLELIATTGYLHLLYETIKYPEYFVVNPKRSNSK